VHALVVPECHGALPAGLEFTLSETTSGLAWESQQPVKVEDVEAETGFRSLMTLLPSRASSPIAPSR